MSQFRGGRHRPAGAGGRRRGRWGAALRDDGQSLVEFAIVVPILLAMLIAIFEFGRAWNVKQVVTNAAREGAREAVVDRDKDNTDDVQATIDRYLSSAGLDPATATVTLTVNQPSGQPETVRISYPYEFQFMGGIVRLISGGSFDGSITLSSTSIMRDE